MYYTTGQSCYPAPPQSPAAPSACSARPHRPRRGPRARCRRLERRAGLRSGRYREHEPPPLCRSRGGRLSSQLEPKPLSPPSAAPTPRCGPRAPAPSARLGAGSPRFPRGERALFTRRRKDAYEALHPEARGQVRQGHIRQGAAGANLAPAFTADTATRTGRSERDVQRDATRGDRIAYQSSRSSHACASSAVRKPNALSGCHSPETFVAGT